MAQTHCQISIWNPSVPNPKVHNTIELANRTIEQVVTSYQARGGNIFSEVLVLLAGTPQYNAVLSTFNPAPFQVALFQVQITPSTQS